MRSERKRGAVSVAANGEHVWKWATRACAVGGFIVLVASDGLDAPTWYYLLLTSLFFGPDVIAGKIKLHVEKDDDKKE